jgi:tripartite-type tricarboxylate transporter receptor subunit TctC
MKLTAVFTALAVAAGCVTQAHAQAYPSHPITIIVPFPAGGPSDTLARILGERMRVSLGQPVIVENVTGAGASIGVVRVAQSAPDGYTLGIGNWTSHVGSGAMYPAAHDALLDLQPIARISATPLMIVGKNALPPQNAGELIAWLKANPGKASAATVGAGSGAHVCSTLPRKRAPISSSFPIAAVRRSCRI